MEIINTKRGGKKLCLGGFIYTVKVVAKSRNEISWRCVKRAGCNGVLKTNKEYENSVLAKEHTHPADQTAVDIDLCRQSMKIKASTTNDKPNHLHLLYCYCSR